MVIGVIFDTYKTYGLNYDNYLVCDFNDEAAMDSVIKAIKELGHKVKLFTSLKDIKLEEIKKCDVVLNMFEGIQSRNRETWLSSYLEMNNIPYIGADAYICIVTLDKHLCKLVAADCGIAVPRGIKILDIDDLKKIDELRLPIIVKPNFEGNSAGTQVFDNHAAAKKYINENLNDNGEIIWLCEEFIRGQELTVPIIGNGSESCALGITTYLEQDSPDFWLDYKYKLFGGFNDCVAELDDKTYNRIVNDALRLYRALGCRDYSRFDFRLGSDSVPYFLEANAFPTICESGSFAVLGAKNNMTYKDIIEKIISAGIERIKKENPIPKR